MTGIYHPDKMILGDTLAPRQVVIVLQDTFRSNGISSVRKALAMQYGKKWWDNPNAASDIRDCAAPSVQYDRLLNLLHGWSDSLLRPLVQLHLVVHLSGGAFKGKLGGLLEPLGLSAVLDNLFELPDIMRRCAVWRGMSSEACYETWNGGQGALIVVDEKDVATVAEYARRLGIAMQVAGRITENQGYTVAITSKFDGSRVVYP